jgi:hypothetical protein
MCRPSCCPGDNNSGLGAVIAILIGTAVLSSIAGPAIHAAEDLLQVVIVAASAVAALAIVAMATVWFLRVRQTRGVTALPRTRVPVRQVDGYPPHGWNARLVKPGTWACYDPRFIYRKFELTQPSTGCIHCDDKIAEWLYYGDLEPAASAQTAKARR